MVVNLNRFDAAIRGIRAPRTAASYVRIAAAFLATDRTEPTTRDVEEFLERKAGNGNRRASSTRNQELAALRALSRFTQREGVWLRDPTIGIAFARVPKHNAPFFTRQELRRLFLSAGAERAPIARARNLALLALMSQAGLRVHEAVLLESSQVDVQQEMLIGIRGKGDTIADIPISPEVAVVIARWLELRPRIAHASETGLFVSRVGRRISIRSVERMVEKLRINAGIKKPASCHSLRHSMATLSLELGGDIATISEILRHSSVAITQRYLHGLDGRRRDVVRRLASTIPREIIDSSILSASGSPANGNDTPKNEIDVQSVWDDAA